MSKFFQVSKTLSRGQVRLGILSVGGNKVSTPAFFPCGTKSLTQVIYAKEARFWGAEGITASTIHFCQSPGDQLIAKSGGLHEYLDWNAVIMSDNGSWALSPGTVNDFFNSRFNFRDPTVTDEGLRFRMGKEGIVYNLTPEISVQLQSNLGSDIAQFLMYIPSDTKNKASAKIWFMVCANWLQRGKKQLDKIAKGSRKVVPKMFAPVNVFLDEQTLKDYSKRVVESEALGLSLVGLGQEKNLSEIQKKINETNIFFDSKIPRHFFDLHNPEQIVGAVKSGGDIFETLLPYELAFYGKALVFSANPDGYSILECKIAQKNKNLNDGPLDSSCDCFTCLNHTASSISKMIEEQDQTAWRLLAMHNVRFYLRLMEKIRRSIEYDSFTEFSDNFSFVRL